jgi:hypothetical protein
MPNTNNISRKTASCPFCRAELCTGISGQSIQIICRGTREQKCGKLIDINFTDGGVETKEVSPARDPPKLQIINN